MSKNFIIATILLTFGISGILISSQIKSQMDQKLFITHDNIQKLEKFHDQFGPSNTLILSVNKKNIEEELLNTLGKGFTIPKIENNNTDNVDSHIIIPIESDTSSHEQIINEIANIEKNLNTHYSNWSLAGPAWTNYNLAIQNKIIQEKIFPIVFILIGILFFAFLRNVPLSTINFLLSLSCTGFSFWLIYIIKGELHILTNLIPLLNFVLPSTLTLHYIYSIKKHGSWETFWKEKKTPIFLTSLTTLAGFSSLYFSSITAIQDFAILSTLTLSFSFIYTLLILFLLSSKAKIWVKKSHLSFPLPSFKITKKHSLEYTIFCIICIIAGGYILPKLPILVEAEKFFSKNHPISIGVENAKKTLGGLPIAEIIIESKNHQIISFDDFKRLDENIAIVEKKFPEFKFLSPQQLLKIANLKYTKSYSIPDFELSAKTLFAQIPQEIKNKSWQENKIKITILGDPSPKSSYTIDKIVEEINNTTENYFNVNPSGEFYFISQSQNNLVTSLLQSFAMSFLISTMVVLYFLRSSRKILNFTLVNLAPVALTLMCFPILNMQINMATVMSFSISFGLIVDGTIHLQFLKVDEHEWVKIPILLSSLCVVLAFLPLSFYSFVPIWQFSLCFCLTLFIGLIFDLYVLEKLKE